MNDFLTTSLSNIVTTKNAVLLDKIAKDVLMNFYVMNFRLHLKWKKLVSNLAANLL